MRKIDQVKAAVKAGRDRKAGKPLAGRPNKTPKVKYRCGHERPATDLAGSECPGCVKELKRKRDEARDKRALPDGSAFELKYLAGRRLWAGKLTVPLVRVPGEAPFVLEYTGTGFPLDKLCRQLADKHRAAMAKAATPSQESP